MSAWILMTAVFVHGKNADHHGYGFWKDSGFRDLHEWSSSSGGSLQSSIPLHQVPLPMTEQVPPWNSHLHPGKTFWTPGCVASHHLLTRRPKPSIAWALLGKMPNWRPVPEPLPHEIPQRIVCCSDKLPDPKSFFCCPKSFLWQLPSSRRFTLGYKTTIIQKDLFWETKGFTKKVKKCKSPFRCSFAVPHQKNPSSTLAVLLPWQNWAAVCIRFQTIGFVCRSNLGVGFTWWLNLGGGSQRGYEGLGLQTSQLLPNPRFILFVSCLP